MKHTRVVSTKCTPGFACRAFSDTTLVCFIVNEHTTKCSHYRMSWGAPVTSFYIEFYFIRIFILIVVTIIGIFMALNYLLIYTLGFLYKSSSGSANAQLPGCFRPWTFSLNIGLNMFPFDSFMSCLHYQLGYSTGVFQALQLVVLAAFWCRGLTTCPLYVGPLFENLV